jgi:hypothetical protein
MSSELTVEDLSPTEFCFEKGKLNFKKIYTYRAHAMDNNKKS